jgi:hypothetical protein
MSIFVGGLDLGQMQDHSALAVIEARGTPYGRGLEGPPMTQLDVRYLHRYELNTKYEDVAADVGRRLGKVPAPSYLAVDETGVGRPVMELLAHLKPHGITITAGQAAALVAPMRAHVPKRDLVGAAQVALQNKILRIAKELPHAELLTRELLNFRAKISAEGHDTYSAWRERDHDDLVLAVSIGVWFAREVIAVAYQQEIERRQFILTPRYQIGTWPD